MTGPTAEPGDLRIPGGPTLPADELEERASRAGGPGGQNVNRRSTRVSLRWSVRDSRALDARTRARLLRALGPRLTRAGAVLIHCDTHRSQARNREEARRRLRELVAEALRPRRPRIPTRPGAAARERRLREKRHRARRKAARRPPRDEDGGGR